MPRKPRFDLGLFRKICGYLRANNLLSQSRQARKGRLKSFNKAIDHAIDTILHQGFAEVQQIAKMHAGKAQVCEQLQDRQYTFQSRFLPSAAFPFACFASLREY